MKKILAKSMAYLFLIGIFALLTYALISNAGAITAWVVYGTIGIFTVGYYLTWFVDWLFEDKEKKDEQSDSSN